MAPRAAVHSVPAVGRPRGQDALGRGQLEETQPRFPKSHLPRSGWRVPRARKENTNDGE